MSAADKKCKENQFSKSEKYFIRRKERRVFLFVFFSCCLILEKPEVRSEEIFNLAFAVHADQCLADGGHRHLARGASATTVIETRTG